MRPTVNVLIAKCAGTEIRLHGKPMLLINKSDLLAVLEEEAS